MITLSPTQREFLLHRLDVSDAIAECFTDHAEDEEPFTHHTTAEIEQMCSELASMIVRTKSLFIMPTWKPSELALASIIIEECFAGNTWFANSDDWAPSTMRKRVQLIAELAGMCQRLFNWADLPETPLA